MSTPDPQPPRTMLEKMQAGYVLADPNELAAAYRRGMLRAAEIAENAKPMYVSGEEEFDAVYIVEGIVEVIRSEADTPGETAP